MLQQNELYRKIFPWLLNFFLHFRGKLIKFCVDICLYLNQTLNNNEMLQENNHTGIKVCVNEVVAMKESHFFIVTQLKDQEINKSLKYRTEISSYTNRPSFTKHQFKFTLNDNKSTLKFGLMVAKSQVDSDVANALVFGVCTFPISKKNLYEQKNHRYENTLNFINCGKDVGKFRLKVEIISDERKTEANFDPLISRVLYDYECKDQLRLQNNIKILESKLQKLYEQLIESKKQEQFFEKLYYDLERDERQLKDEIDNTERINSKIEHRLNSLENLENLQIEIEMLSQSEEGKKILIERLQYFQDRIFRESEQYEKLGMEYRKIKPVIDENLKKAEEHATKLKGKQIQEFQISNNDKILKSYDDLMYQFQVNEQTIKSLSKMSEKSEMTAHQAKLVLSQVNYEIKLTELGVKKKSRESEIMKNIEKEIHNSQKRSEKLSQEQEMVYKIKLSALQTQIQQVRRKIKTQFNE